MTSIAEIVYGMRWLKEARREGHKRKLPEFTPQDNSEIERKVLREVSGGVDLVSELVRRSGRGDTIVRQTLNTLHARGLIIKDDRNKGRIRWLPAQEPAE